VEGSDNEPLEASQPTKKAKQADVRDFFGKTAAGSSKPAAPTQRKISQSMKPSPKSKKQPAKKVVDSDDEDDYDSPPKPKARAGTSRPARATQKKYVELSDDDDDDGSMFVDDD
jgi:DNA topoisomerase II